MSCHLSSLEQIWNQLYDDVTFTKPVPEFLNVCVDPVDEILKLPGIIEIFGESGSGKTQLSQYLSARYVSQFEGNVLFVSLEDSLRTERLLSCCENHGNPRALGDRIFIEHIFDASSLKEFILNILPISLATLNIKILVIDSLAAAFRVHDSKDTKTDLFLVMQALKDACLRNKISCFCMNQVSSIISENTGYSSIYSSSKPALGLGFFNCIDHQFELRRDIENRRRRLICIKSPSIKTQQRLLLVDQTIKLII